MRVITIARDELRGTGIEGRLYLDGLLVGPTLERQAVAIPPGTYHLRRHNSAKHPDSIEILVRKGRRWILIHPGGIPEHSEGCVLLGANDLDGARISGGAPVCRWLSSLVLASPDEPDPDEPGAKRIAGWLCVVCEVGGDVADGVTS